MIFVTLLPKPPQKIALVLEEAPAGAPLATVKLPKSVELPVEAIVTYCIVSSLP